MRFFNVVAFCIVLQCTYIPLFVYSAFAQSPKPFKPLCGLNVIEGEVSIGGSVPAAGDHEMKQSFLSEIGRSEDEACTFQADFLKSIGPCPKRCPEMQKYSCAYLPGTAERRLRRISCRPYSAAGRGIGYCEVSLIQSTEYYCVVKASEDPIRIDQLSVINEY